jgi:hypothetical protein
MAGAAEIKGEEGLNSPARRGTKRNEIKSANDG